MPIEHIEGSEGALEDLNKWVDDTAQTQELEEKEVEFKQIQEAIEKLIKKKEK